jgi:hypothetical protein
VIGINHTKATPYPLRILQRRIADAEAWIEDLVDDEELDDNTLHYISTQIRHALLADLTRWRFKFQIKVLKLFGLYERKKVKRELDDEDEDDDDEGDYLMVDDDDEDDSSESEVGEEVGDQGAAAGMKYLWSRSKGYRKNK